jgi:hypothetical protein
MLAREHTAQTEVPDLHSTNPQLQPFDASMRHPVLAQGLVSKMQAGMSEHLQAAFCAKKNICRFQIPMDDWRTAVVKEAECLRKILHPSEHGGWSKALGWLRG